MFHELQIAIDYQLRSKPSTLSEQEIALLKETKNALALHKSEFVEKMAAVCFMVKNLSHTETSLSHRLLVNLYNGREPSVHKSHLVPSKFFLPSTNWEEHLKSKWSRLIKKELARQKNLTSSSLSSSKKSALICHSYQRLSPAEFHCTTFTENDVSFNL